MTSAHDDIHSEMLASLTPTNIPDKLEEFGFRPPEGVVSGLTNLAQTDWEEFAHTIRRVAPHQFFPKTESYVAGHETLCASIVAADRSEKDPVKLGERIDHLCAEFVDEIDISSDTYPLLESTYSRNYIGLEPRLGEPGWETLVMRWPNFGPGPIHGHHRFVLYRVLDGRFRMRFHRIVDSGKNLVVEETVKEFGPGDVHYYSGSGPGYHHMVHSVECIEPGHSLHIYSGDARMAEVYSEVEE